MDRGTAEEQQVAQEAWRKYELLTSSLSQELCEQLRLVLEPALATKLKYVICKGRFPFEQQFCLFRNRSEWFQNLLKKFPKMQITVEFANHWTETSGNFGSSVKRRNFREEISKTWVYLVRLSSISKNSEKSFILL